MPSDFLKKNFKSMNMSDEEKEKFNKFRKSITGVAAGEKELEMLKNTFLKKLLEEDK
jgi:hypothetical protein|tara:strand:- start:642 stop:812 length:171 start_codon:yes stop_codon:yes gene_type:complete